MKRPYLPMNLQYFADGGEPGGNNGGENGGAAGETMSFDDFLRNGNQAEFDRRVQKAVTTAVANAQDKWNLLMDDKVSEAEKLAKMNAEEKRTYLQRKKEKELVTREADITRRELVAEAKNTLAEKGLPVSLSDILNYADADTCRTSIDTLEKAFRTAVEAAVKEKIKGSEPPKKPEGNNTVTKEQYAKMGYSERLKLKNENPELYRELTT